MISQTSLVQMTVVMTFSLLLGGALYGAGGVEAGGVEAGGVEAGGAEAGVAGGAGGAGGGAGVIKNYSNPIMPVGAGGGADPAVIYHQGKYYFYSTNSGLNVFISNDLVHWNKGPRVLPPEFKGIWAPEVYYHAEDGKFYMYYTKKYKIGVAVCDRPDGMFRDLGFLAIPGIDAHVFRDDDGRLYLYFTNTPDFTMYCVPLKSPTETGGPVTKCFEISHDWERHSFAINEGPWMLKRDGIYYLLYSGSDGQSIYYAIGYATAPTPIGPFTKYEGNPVFQDLEKINGPGHGSVIADRAGQLWHLYHQKVDKTKGWKRDICLDRVSFDDNGVFGGTPTRGVSQAAPICDKRQIWSVDITPRGAVFADSVDVQMSCLTPEAIIRYTTDGSEPDGNSAIYTGPITLTATTTVKARAYKDRMREALVSRMKFTQSDAPAAVNPAPNAPAGDAPFTVFATPTKDWKDKLKK